jgi:uncharacterized protein
MRENDNIIGWFEIPVSNFERAQNFYEKVFELKLKIQEVGNAIFGLFPGEMRQNIVTGALVKGKAYKPSGDGILIYFDCNPDLRENLDRVERFGGEIIQTKTRISPEIGYMAQCFDSEGNRFAMHSRK